MAEGLYARRTDFASAEDAQAAFPRVRALIASPLPEVRKLQVFLLGERLVVLGEPELGVYLLGGLADAIKASLPVRAPLGPWREECARLAARFEAEGDAAYDWTFGGHMLYDDPLRDARTQLAIAESCARAAELYEQARGLRAAVGLEPPSDERAKVIAERLGFLARQAAGMFSKAADDLEAAGDADAAELARSKAKALGGE